MIIKFDTVVCWFRGVPIFSECTQFIYLNYVSILRRAKKFRAITVNICEVQYYTGNIIPLCLLFLYTVAMVLDKLKAL